MHVYVRACTYVCTCVARVHVYMLMYGFPNVCKSAHASVYVHNSTYTTLTIYRGQTNRASKLKFTGDTVKLISNTR